MKNLFEALLRPINKNAKWIQHHRDWAKEKKVRSVCVCVCVFCSARSLTCLFTYLLQVSVRKVNSERLFAKKCPAAAAQLTSYREAEAKSR